MEGKGRSGITSDKYQKSTLSNQNIYTQVRSFPSLQVAFLEIQGLLFSCQQYCYLASGSTNVVVVAEVKTAASRRCIQLTAIEALKQHAHQQEQVKQAGGSSWTQQNWVFCSEQGQPLHVGNLLRRSFRPLLNKANLPPIRFHDLRHSTATLLLTLGTHPKIVQELLGHSQISVTMDVYSHILPTLQEETMRQSNTLLTNT